MRFVRGIAPRRLRSALHCAQTFVLRVKSFHSASMSLSLHAVRNRVDVSARAHSYLWDRSSCSSTVSAVCKISSAANILQLDHGMAATAWNVQSLTIMNQQQEWLRQLIPISGLRAVHNQRRQLSEPYALQIAASGKVVLPGKTFTLICTLQPQDVETPSSISNLRCQQQRCAARIPASARGPFVEQSKRFTPAAPGCGTPSRSRT